MKKILLISKGTKHYKFYVFDYFRECLKKKGYDLHLLTRKIKDVKRSIIPPSFKEIELNFKNCKKHIKAIDPETVVLFVHLKDFSTWPLIFWLKIKKIPFVYWNHGINLQDPNNVIKNFGFKFVHNISDAILLYSPNEIKYVSSKNRKKTFVANNTLNFKSFPPVLEDKEKLLKKYGIKTKKNILFVGRIQRRKRLDDLIDCFSKISSNIGLIIVGPGLKERQKIKVDNMENAHYLGAVYDNKKVNEIFKMSDVFCIPGTNGLGLNQALYWGLPAITEEVKHSPEIYYLKDGVNGYIVPKGDIEKLKEKIEYILHNEKLYRSFSHSAKQKIKKEGSIDKMFRGFKDSVDYCLNVKG